MPLQRKAHVFANLPEKGPPCSVENKIRRSMMCLLKRGWSRQAAENIAREHMQEKGYNTNNVHLTYRKE